MDNDGLLYLLNQAGRALAIAERTIADLQEKLSALQSVPDVSGGAQQPAQST